MATASSFALIAGAAAFGFFLIIFGIRGAARLWRQERQEREE